MDVQNAQAHPNLLDQIRLLTSAKVPSDQRVQLKMPKIVVQQLDKLFPNIDRSHLLTQLAATAILRELQFKDRQILLEQVASEQQGLDTLEAYLEDRDAGIV